MSRYMDFTQHSRMLRGVTRTVLLTIKDGVGRPVDMTEANSVVVTVSLDGAGREWTLHPGHVIDGDDSNIVKFTWFADQQKRCGRYTIDVTADFGDRKVSRVDWHREWGIELVEHTVDTNDGSQAEMDVDEEVEMTGTLVVTTGGMSAYEQWRASDESQGYPPTEEGFFEWMRQPATDAETEVEAAEAQRVIAEQGRVTAEDNREAAFRVSHQRAVEDHTLAVSDTQRAASDHNTAVADHGIAEDDHTAAAGDHTRAEADHSAAAADHTAAVGDHSRAGQDHETAASDHSIAASDHTTAASDHTKAASDHSNAVSDHDNATADHSQAVSDHNAAAADHTQAGADHTLAASDHTSAVSDHTRAEADHSTAAEDHSIAAADHAAAITDAAVTVDGTSGTPSAEATVENNTLTIAFSGLKGADGADGEQGHDGPPGPRGPQGNPGSSVDYPFELINNTKTNDATKGLTAAQGYDLALRPLSEWALDGAGNTFVSIQWTGVMPGHKYRFWIKFWPNSEVTQHGTNYAQCAIWSNSSASRSNALAGAFGNETVAPIYDVEAPSDCTTLILGGRINSGAEGIVYVEDVTLFTTRINQLDQKVGIIGTSQNGFFLVDSALKVAAKYDNDGFDVAKLSAHFQSLINVQQGIFIDVIEDGFFVVDAQYNIGLALTANGIAAKNTVSARIVTL